MMIDTNTTQPRTVLLIASDSVERDALRVEIEALSLIFLEVETIDEAFAAIDRQSPDLLLCEVELESGSGFALARRLRDDPAISPKPMLILLSRWSSEADQVLGFECGADDFVTIPFYPRELASRVRALLRRRADGETPQKEDPDPSTSHGVSIDLGQQTVWVEGTPIHLTHREISIFAALSRSEGRVISRSDLLAQIDGPGDKPNERSIDAHIKSLRNKLDHAQEFIETVHGRGYRYSGTLASTFCRSEDSS